MEYSNAVYCLVDAQLHIHLGSSVRADVTSQVYKLYHIFQGLVLNSYCLVGIGVDKMFLYLGCQNFLNVDKIYEE